MKPTLLPLLLGGCLAALGGLPTPARATDFSLRVVEPGPLNRQTLYQWKLAKLIWNLRTQPKYQLTGGGQLRLSRENDVTAVAVCQEAAPAERDLLAKKDPKAQAAYFRALVSPQATDVKLVSQGLDPLPLHGLTNFEVVYAYNLGGVAYRAGYMVNRVGTSDDHFTALVLAPEKDYEDLHGAYVQLLGSAVVTADLPPSNNTPQLHRRGVL